MLHSFSQLSYIAHSHCQVDVTLFRLCLLRCCVRITSTSCFVADVSMFRCLRSCLSFSHSSPKTVVLNNRTYSITDDNEMGFHSQNWHQGLRKLSPRTTTHPVVVVVVVVITSSPSFPLENASAPSWDFHLVFARLFDYISTCTMENFGNFFWLENKLAFGMKDALRDCWWLWTQLRRIDGIRACPW